MAELLRITQGGHYGNIDLMGCGELRTDGVVIHAPGETVQISRFCVSHVRYPLIVQQVGKLIISDYIPHTYWGDTINLRSSNVLIQRLAPQNIIRRLTYDELHQDIIMQAFAVHEDGYTLDPDGVIENIHIEEIVVCSADNEVNGVMFSERCRYQNIRLGTRKLHIGIEAPYWFSSNNLSDSILGGLDNYLYSISGRYQPAVRIDDVKRSQLPSENNWMCLL